MGYLVKKIGEKDANKQIGNTLVQKMLYLLTRQDVVDFDYSMYYHGPYSSEVSGELSFAEDVGIVESEWNPDKGYFIKPASQLTKFESHVTENERQAIDGIVEKYGEFMAKDLSIIATALYLKDNFNTPDEDLVEKVHDLKRKYSAEHIEKLLEESRVIG